MRAAWTLAKVNTPCRKPDGSWEYPDGNTVWEEVGFCTIAEYVRVCRNTTAQFVATMPILKLFWGAVRKRGILPRLSWWQQTMGLDAEEAA